jgi:hypothetical protein
MNGPLSGTKETRERIRRYINQILEFANGKQFQMRKWTLWSLTKEMKWLTLEPKLWSRKHARKGCERKHLKNW